MSSISNREGWLNQEMCKAVVSTGVSGFSIGGALAPVMYPLMWKSFEQTGSVGTPPSFQASLVEWRKGAPLLSGTICAQIVAERAIKEWIAPDFDKMSQVQKLSSSAVSSLAVGAMTSPLLAVFNGLTMGKAPRMPTSKELLLTTAREGLFVAGITGADPVGKWAKARFGGMDKRTDTAIEYGVTALTATTASVLSHPFDTALSVTQAGVPLPHLMAGWKRRAIGVIGLSVGFKAINEQLQPLGSRVVDQLYSA